MSVPPVTLVTACFYLGKYNSSARTIEKCLEGIEPLLKNPVYLVIFCNRDIHDGVANLRAKYGLSHLTHYILCELEDIWTYTWKDTVIANREKYWPTRDARAGYESHLICCNKFDFVLRAMATNVFHTEKFGWIDANIGPNGSKISTHYENHLLPRILNNIGEKFRIQILNCVDKRYKTDKRGYYETYRWLICGCLFTLADNPINRKILERLKEVFVTTTCEGYGHGEEMLYLEVLDEFYEYIDRAYGDYKHILHNFLEPQTGHEYILNYIVQRFMNAGYNRECYDAALALVTIYNNYKTSINYDIYVRAYFSLYISSFYHCRAHSRRIVDEILQLVDRNPYFKKEFMKNEGFYMSQFKFVL